MLQYKADVAATAYFAIREITVAVKLQIYAYVAHLDLRTDYCLLNGKIALPFTLLVHCTDTRLQCIMKWK